MQNEIVFFIDVDNTLLDNDRVKREIRRTLGTVLGETQAEHFWAHHDSFRERAKLVDFPAITREYCQEQNPNSCEITVGNIFDTIDFAAALYPDALKALERLTKMGSVYVFSEGDMVYQRQKIERSGIAAAADGVLLFEHKLEHLDKLISEHADKTLVFIDDRDDKLMEIKKRVPNAVTVVVCQGHYAEANCTTAHQADMVADSIADIANFSAEEFSARHKSGAPS